MRKNITFYYIAWLIMVISVALSYGFTDDKTMANHSLFSFTNLVAYIFCIISWYKLGGRVLSMYVFFVVYAFFCNAGQSVLYSIGVQDAFMYTYTHESIGDITKMLRFQLLCVSALNLGVCYYLSKHKTVSIFDLRRHYNKSTSENNRYDDVLNILMYISFAFITVTCINMLILRQRMDYIDFFSIGRGESATLFATVFDLLSIILPLRCLFSNKHVRLVYAFYFFFICVFMLVGSRGLAIRYLTITMMCLPMTHPRLFTKKLIVVWIVGVILGFAGLSIISASRTQTLSASNFDMSNSLSMALVNSMDEMGNSERPAVLAITEADGGLGNKQTFLSTIVCGFVPFTSNMPYFQENLFYMGNYLTEKVNSLSGLGSSYIGECYLNYGWLGYLFMLLYGYMVAYGENEANKKVLRGDYLAALLLFAILSRQVAFGRAEFVRLAPLFRWIEIIFIFSLFFRHKKKRSNI